MKMTFGRARVGMLGLILAGGLAACSSSKSPSGKTDGGQTDSGTATDARNDAGGPAPTVVATLDGVPESLALDGTVLYATLLESGAGHDGMIVSVPKTASAATADAGTVTTLASGLLEPRAIAVHGGQVLWADTEAAFPGNPNVMTVPIAGGTPKELFGAVYTYVRLVIVGDTLYTVTNDLEAVSSFPLAGDAGAGTTIYPGTPPDAVYALDSDGTAVYFLLPGATNSDLLSVPIGGTGTATVLAHNVGSGSTAGNYTLDDSSTLYWSDSGTGNVYSVAKTGGTPKILATFNNGSGAVEIALDGTNVYALANTQLVRFPKAGGVTPVVLASVSGGDSYLTSAPGNTNALVVDDAFVYWLYRGHDEILKIAK
ncbi:MAG TPA: hypothetical protein VH853_14145 [Polyangia bacterium]|jgi:hypothetical protein|nr:hypothetical protein [Polyangia bacterium]